MSINNPDTENTDEQLLSSIEVNQTVNDNELKKNDMLFTQELKKNQELFLLGKIQLAEFDEIKKKRPLTRKEIFEEAKIKINLFNKVRRFATSLMNGFIRGYIVDSDAREEIMGSMSDMFFIILKSYDPTATTPTTYFKKNFLEVIRTFINDRSQHLSPNDAGNLKRINKAIKECETSGIEPTEEILHSKTKLSQKVIKNTLKKATNTIYCDISDVHDTSITLNPAEIYEHEETINSIHEIINNALTDEEIILFMTYANLDGNTLTYKEMVAIFGLPEHVIKSKISKIIAKLQTNSGFKKLGINASEFNSSLNFIDTSSDEVVDDILRALSE